MSLRIPMRNVLPSDYVAQIGNPYRYLDDGIVVEIGYTDTEISLQDRLLAYANSMDRTSGKLW